MSRLRLPSRMVTASSAEMEEQYLKSEDDRQLAFTRRMYEQHQEFAAEEKAQSAREAARAARFGITLAAFDAEFERKENLWDRSYAEADARQEDTFQKDDAIRETMFMKGQDSRMTTFREDQEVRAKRSEWYAAVRKTRFLEGRQARRDVCDKLQAALKEQLRELLITQQASFAADERRRDELVQTLVSVSRASARQSADDVVSKVSQTPDTDSVISSVSSLEVQSAFTLPLADSSKENPSKTTAVISLQSIPMLSESPQGNHSRSILNPLTTSNEHVASERGISGQYSSDSSSQCPLSINTSQSDDNGKNLALVFEVPRALFRVSLLFTPTLVYSTYRLGRDSEGDFAVFSERAPWPGAESDALPQRTTSLSSSTSTGALSRRSSNVSDSVSNELSSEEQTDEPSAHGVPMSRSSKQPFTVVHLEQDSNGIGNDTMSTLPSFLDSFKRAASRLTSRSSRSGQGTSHTRSSSVASVVTEIEERFRLDQEQRQRAFLFEEETRETRFTAAEATRDEAESERVNAFHQSRRIQELKFQLKETAYQQEYSSREVARKGRNVARQQRFEAGQNHRLLMFDQSLSWVENQYLGDNTLEDEISGVMKSAVERLVKEQREMLSSAREGFHVRFVEEQARRESELIAPSMASKSPSSRSSECGAGMSPVPSPSLSPSPSPSPAQTVGLASSPPTRSSGVAVADAESSVEDSPSAGSVPAALFRVAGPEYPLPIPDFDVYKHGTKTVKDLQKRRQHLFEKSQTERELAFESGIERRRYIFELSEQRRQLEFEKKQAKRNDAFRKDKDRYEIKFRKGQNEREKAFVDAEAEHQSSFRDSEASRDVVFGSSMKDMGERFYNLQDRLQRTCFEAEDRRLSELEAWGSEMLRRRAKEEEDCDKSQTARFENHFQEWLRPMMSGIAT
ncbi:hypothetical protein D9615_003316 [Tricholomella constricta]|uniref:Uncharacterized protein n=1 Tax=Tricholomella constricta TaxID=117010 RepID=A0A8H5M7Q2_9AGAR|nr:hypothetical protein D9615_003316 [Tricholomella constricta]